MSSCKKEDIFPDEGVIPQANFKPNYPTPADADVILVALEVATPVTAPTVPGMPDMEFDMTFGMGVAIFGDNEKADKVLLNGTELKFSNGVHLYEPDYSNPDPSAEIGIDFDDEITWNVSNPDIDRVLYNMPTMPVVSSEGPVVRANGFTISNTPAYDADSIIYAIYSNDNKYVMKTKVGNSSSHTFTSSDLSDLVKTENGIIQATAYKTITEMIDGKKVYFINESSYSIPSVEIK